MRVECQCCKKKVPSNQIKSMAFVCGIESKTFPMEESDRIGRRDYTVEALRFFPFCKKCKKKEEDLGRFIVNAIRPCGNEKHKESLDPYRSRHRTDSRIGIPPMKSEEYRPKVDDDDF